jgi:hypothetical protein
MKSATTYLQELCELHLDHLAHDGVLWPRGVLRYAAVRDFFGRAQEGTDPAGAWRALVDQIRGHDGDVVLSNELLAWWERGKVERLVRAFAPAEVHVVITGRDPARVIPSAWQTAIRNGAKTYSWREFSSEVCSDGSSGAAFARGREPMPENPSKVEGLHEWFWRQHDFGRVVTRWLRFVPRERITLVTVPPPGSDREIVARRFGRAIGVDLDGLSQPTRSYSTLGAYSTELVRRVNMAMPQANRAERKYGVRSALAAESLGSSATGEPGFGLTEQQHAWVRDRAHRMVEDIQTSGIRIEGDTIELIPTTRPSLETVDPTSATDTELLEAAVQGLVGMARQTARLRRKCNDLRAEAEKLRVEQDVLHQHRPCTVR